MMRFLPAYLVFLALRLGLTVAVGWVAVEYVRDEFDIVSSAVSALTKHL